MFASEADSIRSIGPRVRRRLSRAGMVLAAIFITAALADAQTPANTVQYFVPDGLTRGNPANRPFIGTTEFRYQLTIARDRLARAGGLVTGIYVIPKYTGHINVSRLLITLGHGSSPTPSTSFDTNLNAFAVVYDGPVNLTAIQDRALLIKFAVPYRYDGQRPLVVDLRGRGPRDGVSLYGASSLVQAIYQTGDGAFFAQTASSGIVPGFKVGVQFTTQSPTIACVSQPTPGQPFDLSFRAPGHIGQSYTAGASFSSDPGIDIGEYTVPLTADSLFFSAWQVPGTFQNFNGTVGGGGATSGAINLPNEPSLIGTTFVVAFITHSQGQVTSVSMEQWVTIGQNCLVP